MGRRASAQRQPRCQPRPRLSTRRLSAARALRHEVREEPVGAGGEVGLVVCKPGGRAAGETGDKAACIAASAAAGAGRRQSAGPAAAGEAGCSRRSRLQLAWSVSAGLFGVRQQVLSARRPGRPRAPPGTSGAREARHVSPHVAPRVKFQEDAPCR